MTKATAPLLDIRDLHISFAAATGDVHAVRGLSLRLGREKLGIVGESGSGKTMTGRAILGLIRPPGRMHASRLDFDGIDLLSATKSTWRTLRGKRMTMVMQDPKFSLNPVMQIGMQLREGLQQHERISRNHARNRVLDMLEAVKIHDPERVYRAYPHELSGGMGQRVMIAMMLIPEPDLLIADEPTSALDVTVQQDVLAILRDLVAERGLGLIFISHDLKLASRFCDRILVMYKGRVMEEIAASALEQSKHPYTRGLLNCLPRIGDHRDVLPVLKHDPQWENEEQGND